jgi:hypothetical protein
MAVAALLRERARRRRGGVPKRVRAKLHHGPGRVTVKRDSQTAPTVTVRLEPDGDGGTQTPKRSGPMTTAIPTQPLTARIFLFGGTQNSLDLGDLVVGRWRKYADLTAVAKRTIAPPDSTEVVKLATHCINSTHRPFVELLVDDIHVVTVSFELCIEFVVRGLVATVRHGHLVALRSGSCDVTATLAAEGRQLVTRQAQLQLPVVIRIGDGVPLLLDAVRPLARG